MNTSTISDDRTLTLGEAVRVTGFSAGKFRYNKELLVEAGVQVSNDGWSIPMTVLHNLGWVGVKPPKGSVKETPLSIAQARIIELEAEVAKLRSQVSRPRLFGRKR